MSTPKATHFPKKTSLPLLADVSQGFGSLQQEMNTDGNGLKTNRMGFAGSQSDPSKNPTQRTFPDKEAALCDMLKAPEELMGSPKRVNLLHLINKLGIKPAVFYSLRPEKGPELKTSSNMLSPRKAPVRIIKLPRVQNPSSNSLSILPSITLEAEKQAISSPKTVNQSLRSPRTKRIGSFSKPILKKSESKNTEESPRNLRLSWEDVGGDFLSTRRVRFSCLENA